MNNTNIPNEYKPISAWGYFGYNILFSIPIIGFIFLIVFSFDSSNINRIFNIDLPVGSYTLFIDVNGTIYKTGKVYTWE